MRRAGSVVLSAVLALAALGLVLGALAAGPMRDAAPGTTRAFLPSVFAPAAPDSPAGRYNCLEYEFGLIWTSEVITLHPDGSSVYAYGPPYGGTVTGTWAYVPALQAVQFTHFRWPTATYEAPDRLWASEYLSGPGFEIRLECARRVD